MIPTERRMLRHFLEKAEPPFEAYRTEIPLICESPEKKDLAKRTDAIWLQITAPRIDAIAVRNGDLVLIEVKRYTTWSTIAQLHLYRELWQMLRPHTPATAAVIVTENARTDLQEAAKRLRIEVATIIDDTRRQ